MKQSIDLKLEHFSDKYMDILNTFVLSKDQIQFTALPTNFIEVIEGQHRIVILRDKEPVGFFLLNSTDRVKDYSNNPKAMLLTSLSINQKKQGNGYAKKAMLLVSKFVQEEFPNCNEVVLAVNHKNTAAQQLYLKTGFRDTGNRKMGPIGEQWIMNSDLED